MEGMKEGGLKKQRDGGLANLYSVGQLEQWQSSVSRSQRKSRKNGGREERKDLKVISK